MSTDPASPGETEGPATETQEKVARIWAEVLKKDTFGVNDDFFAIGGNSMTATLATYQVREEFEIELPLMAIFEDSTVVALAKRIDELVAGG